MHTYIYNILKALEMDIWINVGKKGFIMIFFCRNGCQFVVNLICKNCFLLKVNNCVQQSEIKTNVLQDEVA